MKNVLSDAAIVQLIEEDVPYFDLTTVGLGIGHQPGTIQFCARHPLIVCATEEAARVFEQCQAIVEHQVESGTALTTGDLILKASGSAEALHIAWRIALNLLEYASGIASRTHSLVQAARQSNPAVSIVGTRKVFPGTRKLSVKALLAGGAVPHRLGLSETILIFKEHLTYLDNRSDLLARIRQLKQQFQEHPIAMEIETIEDAWEIARATIDIIQFDKVTCTELKPFVPAFKSHYPGIKLAVAGGITLDNVQDYAETGVDLLVTSAPYFGKPADIGVKMARGNTSKTER